MKVSTIHQKLTSGLDDRIWHVSPGRGIFVKSNPSSYHHISVTEYLPANHKYPPIPRFKINKLNTLIPKSLSKKWGIGDETFTLKKYRETWGSEITTSMEEIDDFALDLGKVLTHIENGLDESLAVSFPITEGSGPGSIWSQNAADLEKSRRLNR